MESIATPPIGNVVLLHAAPADETAPCMYCGKAQPWGSMEPCDGPVPLRTAIEQAITELHREDGARHALRILQCAVLPR